MRRAISRFVRRPWWLAVAAVITLAAVFLGGRLVTLANPDFSDVSPTAYYYDDVTWLADNSITLGCGGNLYCPNDPVTRGQMAAFLHRMAGVQNIRYFSCAGTAFTPYDEDTDYSSSDSLRYRTDAGVGNGRFRCNVVIPDGAVVTAVRFSVKDTSATDQVDCEMWRTNLVSSIGLETFMADAGGTGISATPGSVQLSDTTISAATIDNQNYAYFLQCYISGTTSATGIWGASVEYTIAGVPAP